MAVSRNEAVRQLVDLANSFEYVDAEFGPSSCLALAWAEELRQRYQRLLVIEAPDEERCKMQRSVERCGDLAQEIVSLLPPDRVAVACIDMPFGDQRSFVALLQNMAGAAPLWVRRHMLARDAAEIIEKAKTEWL